jgi:predicted Fe-Mo cluster-binding NifX family protein
MNLTFAFAVNTENLFERRHFGDADKYLFYEQKDGELAFLSETPNRFRDLDEEVGHGSKRKGKAIIEFLKEKGVHVLVSKQFGKNLKLVNEHFIPVIIDREIEDVNEVLKILYKHVHWFEDEWINEKHGYKLFIIKAGVLKSAIE